MKIAEKGLIVNKALTFQDVLMVPAPFSNVESRADVDTTTVIAGKSYKVPLISSNMDTVYSPKLAQEVARNGAVSCVHRFCSIEENIKLFKEGILHDIKPWVSVGVTEGELERAEALIGAGAEDIVVDVANAANIKVTDFVKKLASLNKEFNSLIVGNFATKEQLIAFKHHAGFLPRAVKIGIGNGSLCETRVVTGNGYPTYTSLKDCLSLGLENLGIGVILDGGGRELADFSKALAAGASMVMMGRNFAACQESGGAKYWQGVKVVSEETIKKQLPHAQPERPYMTPSGIAVYGVTPTHTEYRGSASTASYKIQGKEAPHRPSEGAETIVPITGNVSDLVLKYEAALRSCMSYQNAFTLEELRSHAEFVEITQAGQVENGAFGKV